MQVGENSGKNVLTKKENKMSESKKWIESAISEGKFTRSEIISAYVETFPNMAKSTVATYLSDSLNAKYTAFNFLATTNKKSGVFKFTKRQIKTNYYRKNPRK